MKQNNSASTHFRQPSLEVVLDGLVGMQAINVQQVYAAILEF
jgi:hypothetical protein